VQPPAKTKSILSIRNGLDRETLIEKCLVHGQGGD